MGKGFSGYMKWGRLMSVLLLMALMHGQDYQQINNMETGVSTLNSELFQKDKLECLKLSSVELNIARLVAWGYTQKEIAEKIHRSPFTISVHL